MNLSFMTILTITFSLCILLAVLLPFLTCRYCLKYISTDCLIAFCMAVLIRALFPVEFSFSRTIPDSGIIPVIRDVMIAPVSAAGQTFCFCHILFFIWLAAACFLLLKKLLLCRQIQTLVRRMPDCKDLTVQSAWKTILKKYPAAADVRILRTKLKISPQIMGILHPVILLPEYPFTQTEYEMILEHEALHCLRHDILLKTAVDFLCTFYWWNPLFYLLRSRIFDLIEIRNDSRMTRSLSDDEKAVYMQCLTDTVKKIQEPPIPLALPLGRPDQKVLHRRMYVVGYSRLSGRIWQAAFFLFLLLSLGLATSFTLEPYEELDEPYFVLDAANTFLVKTSGKYEVYYQGDLLYTTDSIDYFSKDIPVYEKRTNPYRTSEERSMFSDGRELTPEERRMYPIDN